MTEPSFPLHGDLKDFAVNRLLQTILAEELDGCLTVSRDSISRRLYLKGDMITYASSTERSDRLGEILVAQGLLTRAEVDDALKKGSRMRRIGMILLVEGKITPQELFQGVSAQVVTILERMRSWRKGSYTFEVRREPKPGTVLLRIPLALYLGQAIKGRRPEPKKDEDTTEVPVGLNLVDDEPKAGSPGSPPQNDDLTLDELFGSELPDEDEEDEVEITVEDEDQTRGTGPRYGEINVEGNPDEQKDLLLREKAIEEIAFQIQELRGRLAGGSHKILGVNTSATVDEIKESFDYFSRLLHPDKLPASLPADIAGPAADLYNRVVAAYEELTVKKREAPRRGAFAPPPGRILNPPPIVPGNEMPEDAIRPRRAFFRAKKLIEKGNYWQAAESLREAVRQQPEEAEYRNLLGICLIQTGRRLHEAEEHIKEAIRLDPGNPDYVTSLGQAYKAGRFLKKARRMFEQALVYDRGHAEAKRGLRSLPVDTERADKPKNIWTKFFGK